MADVAGLPVAGYAATQTQEAIAQVNGLKILEEKFLRAVEALSDADPRWQAIARTHIQEATMAASRSVFKPSRIMGDLD